mmetsp:Transcript_49520/g.155172  ORF Transcript_49520/g.155172 Transcript_49520/m.155172 type:complete len:238 (-) Transcript_49520:41-754(-)
MAGMDGGDMEGERRGGRTDRGAGASHQAREVHQVSRSWGQRARDRSQRRELQGRPASPPQPSRGSFPLRPAQGPHACCAAAEQRGEGAARPEPQRPQRWQGRMCMAVGAVVGRCERREIFLLAQEAAGEGDAFICSETYRSLDVRKQTVKVREFEVIRELRRLEDGSVRGTKSVILYSDPDPVDDPIALARSLGSLRVWSAMTKGKVPRGSVGLDMTERQRARAVTSYVMSYEREGG